MENTTTSQRQRKKRDYWKTDGSTVERNGTILPITEETREQIRKQNEAKELCEKFLNDKKSNNEHFAIATFIQLITKYEDYLTEDNITSLYTFLNNIVDDGLIKLALPDIFYGINYEQTDEERKTFITTRDNVFEYSMKNLESLDLGQVKAASGLTK